MAARSWLAFQADVTHRRSPDGGVEYVTSASFRVGTLLLDEIQWYGWDGLAWILDGPWTSEETISAHLATFPVGPIGFQVKLSTSDKRVSPVLKDICLAIGLKLSYEPFTDYLYRSLVRAIKDTMTGARPIGRIDLESTGDEIQFGSDSPYRELVGHEAYDVGDGSAEEQANLLLSYDQGTATITLSAPVASGNMVRFYFSHTPQVAATSTSLDFVEVNRTPSVTIKNVKQLDAGCGEADQVICKHNGIGVFVPAPRLVDIAFEVDFGTALEWDMNQLQAKVSTLFADGSKVRSTALDEYFDVRITTQFAAYGFTEIRPLHRGSLSAVILSTVFYDKPPRPAYAVKGASFTGGKSSVKLEI